MLEALVALTILTISTGAVLALLGMARLTNIRTQAAASNLSRAMALLERVGLDIDLEPVTRTGSFDDGAVWQIQITPFHDGHEPREDRPRRLYDIRVEISSRAPIDHSFMLRSLRQGPIR